VEKEMKILLLSAHADDFEIGCGGSVAKFVEEGNEVYCAAFSIMEEAVPRSLPKDIVLNEAKASAEILGILPENLFIYRYPVRKFPQFRQEILEELLILKKRIGPELVFMPSKYDIHQDHHVIAEEGFRAFKFTSILGYEMVWNNITFEATAFILLKDSHVEKKISALKCYKSQEIRLMNLGRIPVTTHGIKALMSVRGVQVEAGYAEAFNIVRWIVK